MAYILEADRTLIFCANPRTGSTAVAAAMVLLGAREDGGHHGQPFYIPPGAIVFQVVRHHREVLNSFWWRSKPTGNFENFLDLALDGRYPYIRTPKMYNRLGITHSIQYDELEEGFRFLCRMVGVEAPDLPRIPSKTRKHESEMFPPHLKEQVRDVYREEMDSYGYK